MEQPPWAVHSWEQCAVLVCKGHCAAARLGSINQQSRLQSSLDTQISLVCAGSRLSLTPCSVQERQIEVDAVMVCNGHYTEPKLASLPGQDAFPGLLMHTHNYRSPHPFTGKLFTISSGFHWFFNKAAALSDAGHLGALRGK